MRLTHQQVEGIIKAFDFLGQIKAELYLYGSRVDDTKKGGDIDLLLVVQDLESKTQLLSEKHFIVSQIKSHIGDQKIDLKIATQTDLTTDPFLQLASEGSKKLKLHNFDT